MAKKLRKPEVGRRLALIDELDGRLLQAAFLALAALHVGLYTADTGLPETSFLLAGGALALVATAALLLVPWREVPAGALVVVPVLDIASAGLLRLSGVGDAIGAAILVPTLWLGARFGRRGAAVMAVSIVLLWTVPTLLSSGVAADLSGAFTLPVVATWGTLVVAIALERLNATLEEGQADREELAEALRTIEHQRRFSEAILDSVDVGLILLDASGAYQAMNRRHQANMRLAFPYGHAGRAGQLGQVFAEDGTTALLTEEMPTYRACHGEEFDDLRIWVGSDPLTRRALSVSARSVHGVWGELAGAALAYTDVTDHMRAMRVKDEFVASVSHELRTPLTSIRGYVDLLREWEGLPAEQRAQLEVVARNTDRLGRLVADLLHTAQAEEGGLPLDRAEADLSVIVRQSVEVARPGAEAKGLELVADVPESLPVLIDPDRMAQVVDNLVSNAIKYTPSGGRVEVSLSVEVDLFELAVRDTGIGIEAIDRERLFTRFFRTRQAEEYSVQGVGLGLSITKSIVESHGGRIEVESEPGLGSTFRVRVPLD